MSINIHATCILLARAGEAFGAPADCGVLLVGESGAGKSGCALSLIAQGALLVADDRVELSIADAQLVARAPENLAGLIEVRTVGIIALPFVPQARVMLAVELGTGDLPRLPEHHRYEPPVQLGLAAESCPPLIRLGAFEAPAKIAAAAAAFAHALFREDIKRN